MKASCRFEVVDPCYGYVVFHPRLGDHIKARQHVQGSRRFVILHDTQTDAIAEVDSTTWVVLSCADGTRDVAGLVAAASRLGVTVRGELVSEVLERLQAQGMLDEGPPSSMPDQVELRPRNQTWDASRPVEPLPDVTWACDGRGLCCSMFETVLMTPTDVHRAYGAWPEIQLHDVPVHRLMTPERGSAPSPINVPPLVEGSCAFLVEQGRCGIHAREGLQAKPSGCRLFPRRYRDDGESIRATLIPECACVLRIPADWAEPVALEHEHIAADLASVIVVDEVPLSIPWTKTSTISRAAFRDWFAGVPRETWPADLAAWLWHLGQTIDGVEMSPSTWMARLEAVASDKLQRDATWRSAQDVPFLALTTVCTGASIQDCLAVVDPAIEHRYLAMLWWGYEDASRVPWSLAVRDRAIRLWVARAVFAIREALPRFRDDLGIDRFEDALAMVEAVMRAQGIGRYIRMV